MSSYPEDCLRLQFLRRTFGDHYAQGDVEFFKRVLQDRESGVNNATTFGSVIMVLKVEPELYVSGGRPDREPFRAFRFGPN
jgi:hypothetical protein